MSADGNGQRGVQQPTEPGSHSALLISQGCTGLTSYGEEHFMLHMQAQRAHWHISGLLYIHFYLIMLSKQLIQPPRQQLPAVTLPQNHKHINVQYSLLLLGFFFFFMKSWLLQQNIKLLLEEDVSCLSENDGSLLSLHLKVNNAACLLQLVLLSRIDTGVFFPLLPL